MIHTRFNLVSGARHVRGGSAQPSGYNLNYAL